MLERSSRVGAVRSVGRPWPTRPWLVVLLATSTMTATAVADQHTTIGQQDDEISNGVALTVDILLHVCRRAVVQVSARGSSGGKQADHAASLLGGRSTASTGSRARLWSSRSKRHGGDFLGSRGALDRRGRRPTEQCATMACKGCRASTLASHRPCSVLLTLDVLPTATASRSLISSGMALVWLRSVCFLLDPCA